MNKGTTKKQIDNKTVNRKTTILVGDPAWNKAEVHIESPQQLHGFHGWALALGIALALLIAGYAMVNRDRELLGQVWEMSKYLISSIIVGRALGAPRG